ncbi:MAG: hypothetical protein JST86_07445 [Bacteroidetes bacterium]|nr:hypothetical protein [Bacteroidota bacterium]
MKKWLFILCIFFTAMAQAQNENAYVTKSFVIITSTKNYLTAETVARKAAVQLHQKLDLRGLQYNKKTGLSFSKEVCENDDGYPCYIARGRYDDGDYVSIEWSNAINGFAKGYYVVIIYSGEQAAAQKLLVKTKAFYKDAYLKTASVYMGCMH